MFFSIWSINNYSFSIEDFVISNNLTASDTVSIAECYRGINIVECTYFNHYKGW